jgi:hypothetical protein
MRVPDRDLHSLADVPELAEILRSFAEPLPRHARARFYEAVCAEFDSRGEPMGPGSLNRICRSVQHQFLIAPTARPLDGTS